MMRGRTPGDTFMLKPLAACAVLSLTVACSQPAAPEASKTATPAPLASGFDAATFDKAVRPQDDLYRYVNGGWLAQTEIPADKASYGGFVQPSPGGTTSPCALSAIVGPPVPKRCRTIRLTTLFMP